MILFNLTDFLEIFELPNRGTVYLIRWSYPMEFGEVNSWTGTMIGIENRFHIVLQARFWSAPEGHPDYPIHILGLLL